MLSVFPVSLVSINLGPSVTGIGHVGLSADSAPSDPPTNLVVPWHDIQENPPLYSLISWHTTISDFDGRHAEMDKLDEWAMGGPAVSIKFVTGDGGTGKSRLAAEFANKLQGRDWSAGFVDLRKSQSFPLRKEGTLLVIDYPEENRDGVAELLRDLAGLGRLERFRVLFLTRQQVDYWEEVIHDSNAMTLVDMIPIHLGPITGEEAHRLFSSAQESAAEVFDTVPMPVSQEALTEWLTQAPENDRALFIVAAAVHSAFHPKDEVVRYTGREVIESVVERELARLRRIAMDRGAKDPHMLAKLLAAATIADTIPVKRIIGLGQETGMELEFSGGLDITTQLESAGLVTDDSVCAVKPDIVAAALVANVLSQMPETAPELVWASLVNDLEGGLERLARLSYDAEVVLGKNKQPISKWLAESTLGQPVRCAALDPIICKAHIPLGWVDASLAVTKTLFEVAKTDADKARRLNNMSVCLRYKGDTLGELEALRKGLAIYRRLCKDDPTQHEPGLANCLINLSNCLGDVGDGAKALDAIREAVAIYRRLCEDDPTRYEPDLAMSLNNLSNRLGNVGDHARALDAICEAVEIRRRLSEADPAHFEPYLASSLSNLAGRLATAGDTAGGLEALREAVTIYRRLCKKDPTRYEPDLATTLSNLANPFLDKVNTGNALDAIREAVAIYRRLCKVRLDRYGPGLARSLGVLGDILLKTELYPEAIDVFREGADIARPFAERFPKSRCSGLLKDFESGLNRARKLVRDT